MGAFAVKPARFTYERAHTLEHALALLHEQRGRVAVLAGGQSLIPLLNLRRRRPEVVLDITRVSGLDRVEGDGEAMTVGALVTQHDLGEHEHLDDALRECLPYTGHYATRHRGTIGGSIAHGEPRGELPLTLLTLGGSAQVRSRSGQREIPAEQLYVGPFQTTLEPDELIVSTRWPRAGRGEGRAFAELAQRHGDFTLACATCAIALSDGEIVAARVGVGAVADRPLLIEEAGEALVGRPADAASAQAAADAARRAVPGYDDHHASAAYRRHLAGVLVGAAARRAMERAGA
jgi:aerobic carbon-monoxide dehydrogenase medium subunit